ncbi:MAG TPA: tyrosine-protein phosphatase [Mycobacterium sp.]
MGAADELPGAWNFRDVASTASTTSTADAAEPAGPTGADGVLRPGRLFRSSELSGLDDRGRATLHALGVTDVADLRSPREVSRRGPGRVPTDVDVHLLPFPDLAAEQAGPDHPAPHEHAFQRIMAEKLDDESVADAAARFMLEEYQRFPTLGGSRRAVRRVIKLLGAGHAVLTHCFAGKDRTGFVVSVVLEAAGLDRDAIVADYLRSNDAVPALRAQIMEMIRQRPEAELTPEVLTFTEARLTDEVLGVRTDYLVTARRSIDENYGSLAGYLRAADVGADEVAALRGALLG